MFIKKGHDYNGKNIYAKIGKSQVKVVTYVVRAFY